MALQEIPHLNQSAFLKLKAPNLYVVAMAKFFASFNDFSLLFSAKRNKTQRQSGRGNFLTSKEEKQLLNANFKIIVLLRKLVVSKKHNLVRGRLLMQDNSNSCGIKPAIKITVT